MHVTVRLFRHHIASHLCEDWIICTQRDASAESNSVPHKPLIVEISAADMSAKSVLSAHSCGLVLKLTDGDPTFVGDCLGRWDRWWNVSPWPTAAVWSGQHTADGR